MVRVPESLFDAALLPLRVARAATDVTLGLATLASPDGPLRRPGGYAERVTVVIGEGGLLEEVARVLTDPSGALRLANLLSDLTSADRPLGKALAPGSVLDQLLDDEGPLLRLLQRGGAVDRLLDDGGPVERLLAAEGALDRITRPGGVLDRLLEPEGLADTLLREDGFVDKLTAEGGTLDQLVALGAAIEQLIPRLDELAVSIPELHGAVETLNRAVGPLSELANRIPGSRRRPQAVGG